MSIEHAKVQGKHTKAAQHVVSDMFVGAYNDKEVIYCSACQLIEQALADAEEAGFQAGLDAAHEVLDGYAPRQAGRG